MMARKNVACSKRLGFKVLFVIFFYPNVAAKPKPFQHANAQANPLQLSDAL